MRRDRPVDLETGELSWLTDLFGGYPIARGIHLAAMICIALFIIVHLVSVAISPRNLIAVLTGTATEPEESVRLPDISFAREARRHG